MFSPKRECSLRSVESLFFAIGAAEPDRYTVYLTFVELYNNSFRDLLDCKTVSTPGKATKSGIVIRDHPKKGVFLEGSDHLRTEVQSVEQTLELLRRYPTQCNPVASDDVPFVDKRVQVDCSATSPGQKNDLSRLLRRGNRNRAVGRTHLNEHSSRSHAIVTIEVESRVFVGGASTRSSRSSASSTVATPSRSRGEVCRRGKLHIVDLAGSERLGLSGCAEDPVALAETQAINLSLTALGACYPHQALPCTTMRRAWRRAYHHCHAWVLAVTAGVQVTSCRRCRRTTRSCGWCRTATPN